MVRYQKNKIASFNFSYLLIVNKISIYVKESKAYVFAKCKIQVIVADNYNFN